MNKIKHYRVLSGSSAKSLEDQVIDLILNDGYSLQGGVSVGYAMGESSLKGGGIISAPLFSQAMVLYESNEIIQNQVEEDEWIPDGKNGFYHGVYQDDSGEWNVAHFSECEGGENCRLFKYLSDPDRAHYTLPGYEYTVTEVKGAFYFEAKKLEDEESE